MQQVGHELGQHPDGAEQADQRGAPPEIQVGPSTAQPRSDLAGEGAVVDRASCLGYARGIDVTGLGNHLDVGLRLEEHPQAAPHHRVIVGHPERFLALRAPIDLRGGRPFDPDQLVGEVRSALVATQSRPSPLQSAVAAGFYGLDRRDLRALSRSGR